MTSPDLTFETAPRGTPCVYRPTDKSEPQAGEFLAIASRNHQRKVTFVNVCFGRGCQRVQAERVSFK